MSCEKNMRKTMCIKHNNDTTIPVMLPMRNGCLEREVQ